CPYTPPCRSSGDAESGLPAQQTDRAIIAGARRIGIPVPALEMEATAADSSGDATSAGSSGNGGSPASDGWQPVGVLPFESSRGYHATAGRTPDGMLLSVKGAPEPILEYCTRRRTPTGDRPLSDAGRRRLHRMFAEHAGAGQRLLAVAERRLTGDDRRDDHHDDERGNNHQPVSESDVADLTFLGFVALSDVV